MNVLDRFRLDGKCLLVTGGSRGFGRVIALAAAEAGADIILNARDADALAKTAGEVRERGRQVWTYAADIAEPSTCEDFCKRVLAEAGPIDILVNNVGGRNLDVAIENTDLARPMWPVFCIDADACIQRSYNVRKRAKDPIRHTSDPSKNPVKSALPHRAFLRFPLMSPYTCSTSFQTL